ncbi:gephyrin-like molybdotransferase receptor GlpR, partial [Streptomyces sp. NEAU-H3]|uniref:divisome protein SepX/GlpR n=1 Tax=Streptomyces sp. NEAU-H3 TaxID=2720636 RepID=UPI0016A410AD|nr:hypothetical protein [Streptomyces sp. NEAU-H3]
MSSSGLIYAVIVGAWAAYLVPMWLRRQDELNEARPTERFSTAIRLLSGRAGMERRYAKELRERAPGEPAQALAGEAEPTESVDVRAFAAPRTVLRETPQQPPAAPHPASPGPSPAASSPPEAVREPVAEEPRGREQARHGEAARVPVEPEAVRDERPRTVWSPGAAEVQARARRTRVLARRRRTTVLLFLVFTLGSVVAAVWGLGFLWVPAVPAVLLSAYIAYLRGQERRRFAYTMDRRRAEDAAARLRDHGRGERAEDRAPAAERHPAADRHPA